MEAVWRSFWHTAERRAPWWARAVTVIFLMVVLSGALWGVLAGSVRNWDVFWKYREAFFSGWLLTIELAACALVGSTVLGVVAALGRRSGFLPVRYLAVLYVELVRGLPFLVLILILFYGSPEVTRAADRFVFGVMALSIFEGAYIAEIVRAGIESVGEAQWESARAIGLTRVQTYIYVVYPQCIKTIIPPLTGQFASLVKDSSLLSIIGLSEFTYRAQGVFSATYSGIESFLPLGAGYLILTLSISAVTRRLERRA